MCVNSVGAERAFCYDSTTHGQNHLQPEVPYCAPWLISWFWWGKVAQKVLLKCGLLGIVSE